MAVLNEHDISGLEELLSVATDVLVLEAAAGMDDNGSRKWSCALRPEDGIRDGGEDAQFGLDCGFNWHRRVPGVVVEQCSSLGSCSTDASGANANQYGQKCKRLHFLDGEVKRLNSMP
jgi:hypothetical protein